MYNEEMSAEEIRQIKRERLATILGVTFGCIAGLTVGFAWLTIII